MLAWNLKCALGAAAIIDEITLDRPVSESTIKKFIRRIMLLAHCIVGASFYTPCIIELPCHIQRLRFNVAGPRLIGIKLSTSRKFSRLVSACATLLAAERVAEGTT